MDPGDKYGRYERSDQPEECFDHSLHWSEVKEEAEGSQISAVSLGVETSQVCTKDDPDEQDPSFDTVSDIHGVTEQERGHKGMTYLKVKVLPSPVPVNEESEECSLIPVDEEEVASITVKKEENEDWLKSEDEDVVKVSVPWEPLETSPSSSCSDTEDSEMESDNVRDCENHESDISGGLKIEDCSRIDPGMTPDTDVKANAVDFNESKGRSTSFYPCPHCTLGFTIERFFHGHLKRAHPEEYIALLKSGEIIAKKKKCSQLPPAMCLQCGKSFSNKYVMEKHQTSHTGELLESPELENSCEESEDEYEPPSKMRIPQPEPSVRRLGAMHMPEMMDTKHAERCRNKGCKSKTYMRCTKCKMFLCITKKRNCFQDFHH